ncbi:DUF1573 domain-containing protein [Lentisphaerota bacterium WC36G]|nr:DUF1573 domain-containing protein [Lentisphaerae bacterium WC36]
MKKFLGLLLVLLTINCFAGSVIKIVEGKDVKFGKFKANLAQKKIITIKNSGDENLIIKNIRTTCGCSKINILSKNINPGETTKLTINLNKNSLSGSFNKIIFIETNDPKNRFMKLNLTGTAKVLYTITPRSNFYLGFIKENQNFKKTFIVKFNEDISTIKFGKLIQKGNLKLKIDKTIDKKANNLTLTISNDETVKTKITRIKSSIEIPIISPEQQPTIKLKITGLVKDEK